MFVATRTMRGSMQLTTRDGARVLRQHRSDTIEETVPINFFTGDRVEPNAYPEAVMKNLQERGILTPKEDVADTGTTETADDIRDAGTSGMPDGESTAVTPESVAGAGSVEGGRRTKKKSAGSEFD